MTYVHKVLNLATKLHESQTRKESGVPYIFHPISIANAIQKLGIIDEVLISAALLHDTVEDCNITLEQLEQELHDLDIAFQDVKFIIKLVGELTRDESSKETKEQYLKDFSKKSIKALLIKVLDRLDNIEDFAAFNPGYAPKYARKGIAIFEAFTDRLDEFVSTFGQIAYDELEYRIDEMAERFNLKA